MSELPFWKSCLGLKDQKQVEKSNQKRINKIIDIDLKNCEVSKKRHHKTGFLDGFYFALFSNPLFHIEQYHNRHKIKF